MKNIILLSKSFKVKKNKIISCLQSDNKFDGYKETYIFQMAKHFQRNNLSTLTLYINEFTKDNRDIFQNYLFERIKKFKADIIFCEDPILISPDILILIKKNFKKIKIICHYCAAVKKKKILFELFDQVISCSPAFLRNDCNSKIIYHASPDYGFKIPSDKLQSKIKKCCFMGSMYSRIHYQRIKLLNYLRFRGIDLDIYSGDNNLSNFDKVLKKFINIKYPYLRNLYNPLYGNGMLEKLSKYICAVNIHAGFANKFAANMRLFEAACVGTCLITEEFSNLKDIFEPDHEIITYRSKEECFEKIKYCLSNPEIAFNIGQRAKRRAINNHTYSQRVNEIIKVLN